MKATLETVTGITINRDIDALVDLKAEARKVISKLDNPEQQLILEMRYLCYKSWAEIAEDLSFSESNVYKIHGEALKRIVLPETAHLLTT